MLHALWRCLGHTQSGSPIHLLTFFKSCGDPVWVWMNDCHFSSHKNSHCKFVSKGIQYKIVLLCRCLWSWWWWWWCLFSVKEREEEGGDGKDRSQKKAAASSNEQLASTNQLSSLTALIRNWECQPVHDTSLPFCLLFWFTWISSH